MQKVFGIVFALILILLLVTGLHLAFKCMLLSNVHCVW